MSRVTNFGKPCCVLALLDQGVPRGSRSELDASLYPILACVVISTTPSVLSTVRVNLSDFIENVGIHSLVPIAANGGAYWRQLLLSYAVRLVVGQIHRR
jgi:hypothetical protein